MKRRLRTLFPPLDRSYRVGDLSPLLIGGMIEPVAGGDGGINRDVLCQSLTDPVCQPSRLLIGIDPWWKMLEGDHLDVYWDTELIATHDVVPEDINERILLPVPGELIKDGWAEKVFYRLTREVTEAAEESSSKRIKVKRELPGGFDHNPALPGHSELKAPEPPADIIENGVDQQWARDGFTLTIQTYPGRMARDTIGLAWGDVVVSHVVSEAEADSNDPIQIPIDQTIILAAGDSENLVVDYEVYDEVYNFAKPRSMQTSVSVEAGAWRLDAPIIGEGSPTIDLGDLESRNVIVHILAREDNFTWDDEVEMTWLGTDKNGEQLTFNASFIIDSLPEIYDVEVPNAVVRATLGGSGQATYVLKKANGDPWLSSKRATVRIVGEAPLPAPSIFELIGDTLAPDLERAHVEIPDYGMEAGDFIVLSWLGTKANGSIYLHEDTHNVTGNEAGAHESLYIPVMGEHISILKNGTLDVSYNVSNDAWLTASTRRSEHLLVKVSERYAQLPAPSIVEAPDAVLDPELHPDSVTLRVGYDGTEAGDLLTWYWQGISEEGSGTDSFPITTGSAGDTLDFTIARSLIEPNINNEVQVFYTLKLGSTGEYQYSAVLNLTIGKLIGDLPPPAVQDASAGVLDPMKVPDGAKVTVKYGSMEQQDVITLVWLGSPNGGTPPDQEAHGSDSGEIVFTVPPEVIGANIGREVFVSYRVKRYTAEKNSETLRLSVLFGDPDNDLPHPTITQADSQAMTLNLATFAGNATVTVAKWPFSETGQRVWLRLEGENSTGGFSSIPLLEGAELTSNQALIGLSEPASRNELEKLGQDTRLTVICNVAFDGVDSESVAVAFPEAVYDFKLHYDWLTPVIVNVRDLDGEVENDETTYYSKVTASGTSTVLAELEILDGASPMDTTRASEAGNWTIELPRLQAKSYSLTAKALDDSSLISRPRTFKVLPNLTPIIEQVKDSRGLVSNGGTTVDVALTVSGQASPDEQVELFDNDVSKGKLHTDGDGMWTVTLSPLSIGSHEFRAKAHYGTEPQSELWKIKIETAMAPTIASVTDSKNVEVPPEGFTVDVNVALSGSANANLQVEVFDANRSLGMPTATPAATWSLPVAGLSLGRHVMKARACYGENLESDERGFTVTADVAPSITSVVDPAGTAVPPGQSTFANTVTASGQASIGQQVQVLDGDTPKGNATADGNGRWGREVSALATGFHTLKARALYGAGGRDSTPWSFNVLQATVPQLIHVKDPNGEVGQNGSTVYIALTVTGTAAAGQQVDILDNNASKGSTSVTAAGEWSLSVSGLVLGNHSIKAKGLYGERPDSNVRNFRVESPVPDFVLNTSQVSLSGGFWGLVGYPGHAPLSWPANTRYQRVPSSGVAPYSYSSSDTSKAMVSADGWVTSVSNGSSVITVRDAQGRSGNYTVVVSNVRLGYGLGNDTFKGAQGTASSRGLRIPSLGELRSIYAMYGNRWPMGNGHYWSTDGAGLWKNYVKNLVTGEELAFSVKHENFGSYAYIVAIAP
ncbi:hypothetical protein [Pseudomonas sp. ME-P-057]|uniref:hypothetical protein n=1 Tax=Pseudomonas sp. ME-P-057 TaxID=3040321 RepID=UPI002553A5AD|nr:hypothetical protein [Pseudomonas sp. ME-P-057]